MYICLILTLIIHISRFFLRLPPKKGYTFWPGGAFYPPTDEDADMVETGDRGRVVGLRCAALLVAPALALLVLTLLVRFRFSRSRSFHLLVL